MHLESSGIHAEGGSVMCKSRECHYVLIHRYYNIPLVNLIKNAKILKFTSCEVKHNYYEQKVRVLATLVYAQFMGIQSHCHSLASLCAGAQGHPVTSSWLTSLCVGAQGHPVTSSQLTPSKCQGQSRSGYYQVLH